MIELEVVKLGENFKEFQYIISQSRANDVYSKYLEENDVKEIMYPLRIPLQDDNGIYHDLKIHKAIQQKDFSIKLFCSLVTANPKEFFAVHIWADKPKMKEEELSEVMQEYVSNMNELMGFDTSMEGNIVKVTEDIKNLLLEKNRKYGNQALDPINIFSNLDPISAIRVRIDDKLSRIKNYGISGDGKEDTLNDLIGYLILLKIAIKDVKE